MQDEVAQHGFETGGGDHGVSSYRVTFDYATLTFSPRGPLGPWPTSNVTACPSRRSSKRVWAHAELWKKYSVPSPARMKPKPLSETMRLMVPVIEAMCVIPSSPVNETYEQ